VVERHPHAEDGHQHECNGEAGSSAHRSTTSLDRSFMGARGGVRAFSVRRFNADP
jgi:hypothetical protein